MLGRMPSTYPSLQGCTYLTTFMVQVPSIYPSLQGCTHLTIFMVQVPSSPADGEASSSKRAKGSSGAVVGRWQDTPTRSSSAKELRSAALAQVSFPSKSPPNLLLGCIA